MEETKRKWEQDGFEDDGSLACLGLNTDRESKSFSCPIAQQQALAGQTFYIVDAFADVDLKGKNMYLYKMKPTLDAPETEARKVWTGKIVNVIGYEGLYAVSDQGIIYNLKRGTIVKPTMDKSGYLSVILSKGGVQYTTKVHKVVFYSFVGQDGLTREDSLVIDHIDGDKTNNALYNLRKITTRENTSRSKTTKYGRGFHFYEKTGKFGAEIQINKVRYFLGTFDSAEDASMAYETALERYEKDGILPEKRRKQK